MQFVISDDRLSLFLEWVDMVLVKMPKIFTLLTILIVPPGIVVPQILLSMVIKNFPLGFVCFSMSLINMRIYFDIHDLFLLLHNVAHLINPFHIVFRTHLQVLHHEKGWQFYITLVASGFESSGFLL